MEPTKVLELFRQLSAHNGLDAWLKHEKADAVKYLVEARDPVAIHRAQGKSLFIDEMTKLLDKVKNLR